jgi:hypothetical protein
MKINHESPEEFCKLLNKIIKLSVILLFFRRKLQIFRAGFVLYKEILFIGDRSLFYRD